MTSAEVKRDQIITFSVRRGSFTIPSALQGENPQRWAHIFASSVPTGAVVSSYRDGADEVFNWRVITTHVYDC